MEFIKWIITSINRLFTTALLTFGIVITIMVLTLGVVIGMFL